MSLRQGIRTIVAVALLAIAMLGTAQAQEVQRIIAVVNDEAVSSRDVIERVRLVVLVSGLNDSPELRQRIAPQVLRTLIDEHLRLQEAERRVQRGVVADHAGHGAGLAEHSSAGGYGLNGTGHDPGPVHAVGNDRRRQVAPSY